MLYHICFIECGWRLECFQVQLWLHGYIHIYSIINTRLVKSITCMTVCCHCCVLYGSVFL